MVLLSVLVAVTASVSTQYGMKHLIDIVATGQQAAGDKVWGAFAILCGLVAADNLSWRVGGYAAHRTFVAVTGDIRRDLFRHLAGHAPTYFAERSARRAGQPHHLHRQRRVHRREHRRLERAAALRRPGTVDLLHRLGQLWRWPGR